MSDYRQMDGAAIDREITGNYGEDQFRGMGYWQCAACNAVSNFAEVEDATDGGDARCPHCGGYAIDPIGDTVADYFDVPFPSEPAATD